LAKGSCLTTISGTKKWTEIRKNKKRERKNIKKNAEINKEASQNSTKCRPKSLFNLVITLES
jgi:hypothetical protein